MEMGVTAICKSGSIVLSQEKVGGRVSRASGELVYTGCPVKLP